MTSDNHHRCTRIRWKAVGCSRTFEKVEEVFTGHSHLFQKFKVHKLGLSLSTARIRLELAHSFSLDISSVVIVTTLLAFISPWP